MKLNGLLLNENQIEHMKKITTFLLIIGMMLPGLTTQADEGMWIVNMLDRSTMAEMQGMGLNLTAEEIYDINNASLKDAIVRLNGGSCTGEVISSQGLVLTNHHCAYDAIQGFSSTENDYLTDGFSPRLLTKKSTSMILLSVFWCESTTSLKPCLLMSQMRCLKMSETPLSEKRAKR